ncbi:50S ribosomal protein L4 [Patescibacteria group bacterium AH-259-L05]|nr:50S ribosomal protein L4 [Patescibacteria group bacterium AH-259-L05]
MMKVDVYNQEGNVVGKQTLDAEVFGVEIKPEVIHQVVVALRSNFHHPWAHTKTRGEVRGGGRKPWRQKGTGRARVGSIRSPIWRGGGVTFGPRKERNYFKKINKKLKRKVLLMCLSDKAKEKNMYVLDKLEIKNIKTKTFHTILNKIIKGLDKKNKKILLGLDKKDETIIKSARNINGIKTIPVSNLNVLDLLRADYLLTTKKGIKAIEEHFSK